MQKYTYLLLTVMALFANQLLVAQEETPFVAYDVPSQNLVKFNRFLLNPTFSTVREDKSYINLFHRNQSVSFNDNNQTYFLSYSGRIGDRSGVGLSLYTQREGLIENFGLLANYAYGVKLSEKSNLTFGGNFSYYNSGFNQNRANPVDDDPLLNSLDNSALITFQPGFNISYGAFDFGVLADNLFDYNLKTNESLTDFGEKTYTGHLQYTHQFKNTSGVLESARLMPLARVRTDPLNDITLGGSLILDVPKLGWLQAGYDDFYGAAAGVGFNLNKRISLGYTVEKGLSNNFENFGVNHEISLAYSFTPNLTEDRVMLEKDNDLLVENEDDEVPLEELSLTEKDLKIAELEQKLAENNSILDELLYRQDSIEKSKQGDLERRFATVMRMVKRETNGENPELEEKAKRMYFANLDSIDILNSSRRSPLANNGLTNTTASKKVIKLKDFNAPANSDANESSWANTETAKAKTSEKTGALKNKNTTREAYAKEAILANTGTTNAKTSRKINQLRDMNAPAEASSKAAYVENTKKDKITTNTRKSYGFKSFAIPSVESGHYLIANVYKGKKYMQKFIDELETQGIDADYFTNPKNGLNYVYLKDFKNKNDAISAYKTGLDGTYSGDTWVMKVKGSYDDSAYVANTTETSQYDDNVLQKNVQNKPVQNNSGVSYKTYDIDGLGSGFYIIANVFEQPENANRFVRQLNAKGLNASYFINPENNYRYVYLKKHQDWTNALVSYYSKLNDAYEDQIWIMRVKPNQTA